MEKKDNSYLWPTSQVGGAAPPTMINHHVPQDRRVSVGVESSGAYSAISGVTATSGQFYNGNDSTSIQALHASGLGTHEKLTEVRRGVGRQSSVSSKGRRGVTQSPVPGSFSSFPSVPSAYGASDKKMSFQSASSLPQRRSMVRSQAARTRHHGLASFIWGGQASQDTCTKMLDRVRQQFREPQWHGHDPLILPPQIPSASRPSHQEIPKFSRAIQLLRGGLQEYNKRKQSGLKVRERGESQGIRSEENWSSRDEEILFSTSLGSSSPFTAHQRANSKADSQSSKPERTRSVRSAGSDAIYTLPSAAQRMEEELAAGWSAGKSAFVSMGEKEVLGGFPPHGRSISSVKIPPSRRESDDASRPIWELNSMPSKHQRLQEMEVLERRRVERTEMWDRQVVKETMVVHYVTSVLKQQMEEIKDKERAIRMMIRYEEEKDFYYLYNDSPIAQTISKEWKALREKEMKLARIKEREMLYAMEKDVQLPSKEKTLPKKELSDGVGIGSSALATEGKMVGRANFAPLMDEAEGDEVSKRGGATGGTSGGGGIVSRTKSVLLSYFNAAKPSKENQPSLSSSSPAGHAASITACPTGLDGASGGSSTALPPQNGEGEKKVTPRTGGGAALRLGHAGRPRGGPRFPGIFSSSTTHPLSVSGTEEESGGVGDGPLLPKVTKVDPAQLLPPEVTDVRQLVHQYVQQKTCQVVEGGRNKSNAFILPASTENASKRGPTTRKGGPSSSASASASSASASMSSPEVRRVSALVLPPIQSTTGSRRTVVGVADYITLLDEDDQYRALIEISEKEERKDIQRLMREDWRTVMDWQRKCMHLNRLVYWRDQREANLREEVERLTRTVGQEISAAVQQALDSIRTEEAMEREEMQRQETEGRLEHMLLLRLELEKDQREFFTNHVSHDKDCLLQWYYTGYRTIMLAEERHARSVLEVEERKALEREIVQQAHVLHLLQEVECHPQGVAAVETIQKAYHRYRRGVLGYRRTHRVVGREIQAQRTERKVAEGLEVFEKYKKKLYAEMNAVHTEEREKFGLQLERLVSLEFSDRLALTSYEGMDWTTLQRSFLRVLREDIIGGEIRKQVVYESEERMELGVQAELDGEAIFSFAHRCRRLIHQKEMLVFEEGKGRKACSAEEADLRHLLAGDEGREREEIRLEEVTQLAKKAAAIAAIATTFTTEWETLATSACATHDNFLLQLHKKAITKLAFEERFYHHLLYQETLPAVQKAYVEWMEEDHRILSTVQWNAFCQFYHRTQREFKEEMETKERTSLGNEEAVTFHALQHAYFAMVNEKKSLEDEKERAVRLLCRVWRQYCNHELGRSGTRKFLQEAFRAKREAIFIASRKVEQKKLLASVRRELEKEERSITHASAARLQSSLEAIDYQEEPKHRWEIQEEEEMIFHILRSNCFSFQIGRFDHRNQFAMLWQHESYERVLLQREWWREFEKVFYPKKSMIREEVRAIRIQRTWRAYQKRMAQRARRIAAEKELFHAETSDRLFTMEREAVYYMELYHEILTSEFEASVLFSIRPQMEVKEAHERCVAAILREEWTARCELLWNMRYDVADGWFMSAEQRERKALTETQLRPLLEMATFMEEEAVIRRLLQRERVNFLFRMLHREEALQRDTITQAYPQAVVQQWLPRQEALHRQVLRVSDHLEHFWRDTIYLPLATAIKKEIDMEERPGVSWLILFLQEWDERRAVDQMEMADRRRVVGRMEWTDRGTIQTEEQFAREGSLRLVANEDKKRIQLIDEWAVGLQYVPSSFAPHHVYVPTSLFERGIKEAETLVRAYVQRSEETAWDGVVEVVRGVLDESHQRLALEEEEKYTRERRMVQVMECEARNAVVHEWALGLRYVPSSFAPTVVTQPFYVFADGIAQTEAHSRDYITLTEAEERKAIRIAYRFLHEENQSRRWVEQQEGVTRAILLDLEFEEIRRRFQLRREYFIAVRYVPSSFAPSMVYSRISVFVQFVLEEEEILRRQLNDAEWQDRQRIQGNKRDDRRRKEDAVRRAKEMQKFEVIAAERVHRNEIVENAMVVFPRPGTMLCRVPTPPPTARTPMKTGEGAALPPAVPPPLPPSAPPQSGTPSSSSLWMPRGGENRSLPPLPSSSPLQSGRRTVEAEAPLDLMGESEPPRRATEDPNGIALPLLPPAHPERTNGASVEAAKEPSMPSPLPPLVIQSERYVYFVEALESLERKSRKFISRRCIKAYLTLWETAFQERGLPMEEKTWVDDLARAFYVEELNAVTVEDEDSEDYWDVGDNRLDTLMLLRRDHDDEENTKDGEDNVSPSSAPEFYFQRQV